MGAHSSKEKLSRSYSERYIHTQMIERERFGSFGKRASKAATKAATKGAAKKRDVRNLSISPTDLGPPPKTQQTAKGQSTRSKSSSSTPTPTLIQKRLNGNSITTTTTTTILPNSKGNTNKSIQGTKQQQQQQQLQQQQSLNKLKSTTIKNSTPTLPLAVGISEESLRSGVDQTELQELTNIQIKQQNDSTTPRDSKRSSISNELHCICGAEIGCNCQTEAKVKRCEDTSREVTGETSTIATETAPQQLNDDDNKEIRTENTTINTSTNEQPPSTGGSVVKMPFNSLPMLANNYLQYSAVEIAGLYPALKPFTENGYIDFARLAKFFELNKFERSEEHRHIMGLAVMVQYMTEELDAFACRDTKDQCARAKGTLDETIGLLQQTQLSCEELRQELHNKDIEWTQREQEREHLQRTQLKQSQDKLLEVQMLAQERFRELEAQVAAKEAENKQAQQAYHMEVTHKLNLKQEQLQAAEEKILLLQQRIQNLEAQDQELHEELKRQEKAHASILAAGAQREEELQQSVKSLTKELSSLSATKEHNERDLRDRLALSQDEISVLRSTSQRRSPSTSLPDTNSAELCRLTSEAESLRCVLELKQAEISTLSKANEDLKRENDERMKLSNRVALLEAQNEMLRTELDAKTDKEKSLQLKLDEIQKAYDHENMKRTRLTCDKEVLEYHLKQRSERLQQAEAKLQEFSNVSQDISFNLSSHSRCSLGRSSVNCEDSDAVTSPPPSPVIKGVIERNDSVSWILDMDDDVPKVPAPKLVRRAGSLRNTSERSPTQRRQLSLSATTNGSSSHTNGVGTAASLCAQGPNPLSQSMSAAALLRCNHSISNDADGGQPLSRTRSHSVCIRAASSEIPTTAAATTGVRVNGRRQRNEDELQLPEWNVDNLRSSSPQAPSEIRPRTSTMKLISCDSKLSKKFQEIQESAGEAMVSGANSEDESCSASSEEMMRSSSASSTASGGGGSGGVGGGVGGGNGGIGSKLPHSRMSIEEALPCTPMEVSWSEDAADAAEVDCNAAAAAVQA